MQIRKIIITALPFFLIGFVLGTQLSAVIKGDTSNKKDAIHEVRQSVSGLANPLLACSAEQEAQTLQPLKQKLSNFIDSWKSIGAIQNASVYFHEFETGRWFTVNPEEEYTPASLLKVVTMIAYLKKAETDPAILKKTIFYPEGGKDGNAVAHTKPAKSIMPGNAYTIENLIDYMIVYSDNNARGLLRANLDNEFLLEVNRNMGISSIRANGSPDFMTVSEYGQLIRVLYNATYLNAEMSSKALALLGQADFKSGLAAGVPLDILVANKFGERGTYIHDGIEEPRQLHDCGVVYYPDNNYFLCVMTKGNDFSVLQKAITEISRSVYTQVKSTSLAGE